MDKQFRRGPRRRWDRRYELEVFCGRAWQMRKSARLLFAGHTTLAGETTMMAHSSRRTAIMAPTSVHVLSSYQTWEVFVEAFRRRARTEARERTEFHTRIHTANGGVVTPTGCMFSTGRPYRLQLPLALCRTCWPCNAPTSQSCEVGLYLLHPISTDTQGTVVPDGKEFCEKCDVTGLVLFCRRESSHHLLELLL